MGEALDRLVRLTTVTVPPHLRRRDGKTQAVDGYTYTRGPTTRQKLTGRATRSLRKTGGFSVRRNGRQPKTGYMVAVPGAEETFSMDAVSPDTMAAYMNRHSKDLAVETNYFGGWLDRKSGEVYLDISKNVQDLEEAKKLGKDWEQLAIFDLSSMEEIRLAREQAREVVYLPKDDPEAAYEELRKLIDDEE